MGRRDELGARHGLIAAGAELLARLGAVVGIGVLHCRDRISIICSCDLRVLDAPEEVGMAEKVGRVTLKKRSSILLAVELVQRGEADAFFSAGNTAACWTIAKMALGTLPEIDRPALTAVVPNIKGKTVLLDVGANATCKSRHLEEFAVMGSLYAEEVPKMARPRVGLMSMGEEESKGTDLTREVHASLKESHLNFVGNVEGHEIFNGEADVVVMDGFTGNVILKSSETLASSIVHMLKEEIRKRPLAMAGAVLAGGAFKALKKRIDPREVGGAPLLGINGCCSSGTASRMFSPFRRGSAPPANSPAAASTPRSQPRWRVSPGRPEQQRRTT